MAITIDDFMAMPLPVASLPEQQKVADCLASLDELITLEAQKLSALKTHKKGLMQQLFPDTTTTPHGDKGTTPRLRRTPPQEGNSTQNSPPVEGWQAQPDGVVK